MTKLTYILVAGEKRLLREPLPLILSRAGGEHYAWSEDLRVFGHGSTPDAAIKSLREDVAYLWGHYGAAPATIGDGIKMLKRFAELVV